MSRVLISRALWGETWLGLKRLSAGVRESAAAWGGRRDGDVWRAERVVLLEGLGVHAGELFHRALPDATAALFQELRAHGLRLVADVHTHPSTWVGLSETDMAHPLEYRVGLLALVLPEFARFAPELETIGAHLYEGDGHWREVSPTDAVVVLPENPR